MTWQNILWYLWRAFRLWCLLHQLVLYLFSLSVSSNLYLQRFNNFIYIRISESISNTVQPNFSANFQVRTIGLTLIILFVYAFGFIFVKLFPMLMDAIGLDGCTASLCIGCILGAFFIMFTLEEKSGQPLDTLRSTENKWINAFSEWIFIAWKFLYLFEKWMKHIIKNIFAQISTGPDWKEKRTDWMK